MSVVPSTDEIEYPESDGKPVGETDAHIDWTFRIRDILRHRYAGQRVYVGSDMLVYYQEGKPSRFFVPDEFVVLDCEQRDRRVFKIFDEGRTPNVIIELTSRSSKTEDAVFKPQIFELIGVGEYFLYDPLSEYLKPTLQGFRLGDDGYEPIEPNASGSLLCEQLGIELSLDGLSLVMRDASTQRVLLTSAEAAEAKVAELEQEVQRLRDELKKRGS
jgi:Uma2 family endonuclease